MKFLRTSSLLSQFLVLVVSSLLFLVVIAVGAYYKLTDYAVRFSKVTDNSMPKLVRIGSIHSSIKELSYLVEKLADASSSISRRMTYRRIEEIFSLLREDELSVFNEQNLSIEIQIIEDHFNKLHSLIKARERYAEQINDNISKFIKEFHKITFYSKELNQVLNSLTLVKLYEEDHKQSELKAFIKNIEQLFHLFQKSAVSKSEKHIVESLEDILFASDGIIELKKRELTIKIQLKRMTTLVSSLLYNLSGEIEFLSVNHNDELIRESKESALSLRKEVNLLFFLFIIYLLYLTFIIFYLKHKIINRLVALDKNIRHKIKGRNNTLTDDYDDEISYITESFNFYASNTEEQNRKLEELSLTDGLTNLSNRRMFDIQFEQELHFIQRNHHLSSILVVDVDNFKAYNDNYGHLDGDNCLRSLADVLRKAIKRDTDTVARYGGEEFVFILSNSDVENSRRIARELLAAVEDLDIKHEFNGNIGHLTISIGITTINYENVTLGKRNLENADKALYAAKEKGKNTFVHYDDLK